MSCILGVITPYSITGDCSNTNSGQFTVNIVGSAPDYTIQWISPASYGTIALGAGVTAYTETSLSAGTYVFNVYDSCAVPSPQFVTVEINISSGTCVSISGLTNTTCDLDNGSITAKTQYLYGNATFDLYDSTTDTLISSQTSLVDYYVFNSLSAGTYHVIADDGGGCTGRSESCIIKSSTTLTYDLYIIDNAGCAGTDSGAAYVQNVSGTPPYTYLWSNGTTTSSVTGLTSGSYFVTVTDSLGCASSETVLINTVPPVGLGAFTSVSPSCFSSDGEITVTITGGTAPYYFSGSNGDSNITFSQTNTFTNLSAGVFTVQVTDAGLCSFVASTSLLNPNGFSYPTITTSPSFCSITNGQISISLISGLGTLIYTLEDSSGNTTTQVAGTSWTFTNLLSDTYQLTISGGSCVFTTSVVLENIEALIVTTNYTGTTCNQCNGAIELSVSGGTGPDYTYNLTGQPSVTGSFSSYTFTNLCSGTYVGSITDSNRCTISENIIIPVSPTVNLSLFWVNPTVYSNNGSITAMITNGTPPFTFNWSANVNGQDGIFVENLSAGTYTLTVTDSNGCTQTQTVTLTGYVPLSDYQVYNICDTNFTNSGLLLTKGMKQMVNEGFYDLTSADTNCILNKVIFTAVVDVGGNVTTNTFYTGTTLNDYPSDTEWSNVITTMLLAYDGITGVTTNIVDNSVKITTPCDTLSGVNIKVDLLLNYDISCQLLGPITIYSP